MAKIKLVKWRGDNGQMAISFPGQSLSSYPTPIVRQARAAATQAAFLLTIDWSRTIGKAIDQNQYQTFQDYRVDVSNRQISFRERALRRYLKLFKATGLK